MKPTLPLYVAAVVMACLAATTVRADEAAVQQLRDAQTALANAKAWRRTTVTDNLEFRTSQTVVAEAVQPDLFHYVAWSGLEYFSDGKSNRCRDRDGTVREVEFDNVKPLDFAREKSRLQGLLAGLKDARVEERTTFRDLPTTVVAFTIENDGVVSTGKLWISDADHLPLKIESETHSEWKAPSGVPQRVNQRATGSYEYDPSIKIVMP